MGEKVKGEFSFSFYEGLSKSLEERVAGLSSDDLTLVKSYVGNLRMLKNKIPYYLYRISQFGSVNTSLFKALTVMLFNASWIGNEDIRMEFSNTDFVDDFLKVYGSKSHHFFNVIDYRRGAATPLAYQVLSSIIRKYKDSNFSEYGMRGGRVIVHGPLGCGKTTFVFYSVYSVLRLLNFSHEDALTVVDSLFVNDLDDLMSLFRIANRLVKDGLFLPFMIIDDAAVLLSKYESTPSTSSSPEIRKFLIDFSKFYQLSREGVGVIVTISTPNMLIKGVRQSSDSIIEAYTISDINTYTLWIELQRTIYPLGMKPGVESPTMIRGRSVIGVSATLHPPMYIPTEFYNKLGREKMLMRSKLINKMRELIKRI